MNEAADRAMVVDAAAALALLLGETGAERVWSLVRQRHQVLVPWLFWYEVANTLGRRLQWPAARMIEALFALDRLGMETRTPDRPSLLQAVDAVELHGLTAYDAAYLVLAEAEDADLLTGDADLAAVAGPRAIPLVPPRRMAEATARYESLLSRRSAQREAWPGAAAYLQVLRRQLLDEHRRTGVG